SCYDRAQKLLTPDRIQKLVPAGHRADGRFAERIEWNGFETASIEQAKIYILPAHEGRKVATHQARHRDAGTIVADRIKGAIIETTDMRHGIERHRDEARPFERERNIRKLREDADHCLAQRIEGAFGVLLAEGAASAEDDAIVDLAEPAHHPLGLGIGPPRRHQAAGEVRRQFFGSDDSVTRAHPAAGRLGDNAIAVVTEREHRAFLEYRHAALRDTPGKAPQVI